MEYESLVSLHEHELRADKFIRKAKVFLAQFPDVDQVLTNLTREDPDSYLEAAKTLEGLNASEEVVRKLWQKSKELDEKSVLENTVVVMLTGQDREKLLSLCRQVEKLSEDHGGRKYDHFSFDNTDLVDVYLDLSLYHEDLFFVFEALKA